MVSKVKNYRAGFVISDSNLSPEATLEDVLRLKDKTGHSTIAVTEDGTHYGKLLGLVTSRDYRVSRMAPDACVADFMTKFEQLVCAPEHTTLKEANDLIWGHKLNCLPVINDKQQLVSLQMLVLILEKLVLEAEQSALPENRKESAVGRLLL